MRKVVIITIIGVAAFFGYKKLTNDTDNNTAKVKPSPSSDQNTQTEQPDFAGSLYRQGDPRWADETVGGSNERFGDVGCTVCCIAMALEYCGIYIDPGELNTRLKENDGYTNNGWVKWFSAAEVTGNKVSIEMPRTVTLEKIDKTLELNYPVIAKGKTRLKNVPHWVLIVAKDGEDYLVKDPLGDGKSLEKFSKYGSNIRSIRIFKSKRSRTGITPKANANTAITEYNSTTPAAPVVDNFGDLSQFTMPSSPSLFIRSKIDNEVWKTTRDIYPVKGQKVTLKIDPIPGAVIRWYQIIPDITQNYNNSNWPWDPKPYTWKGFDTIEYAKRELKHLRGKWQIDPFTKPPAQSASGEFADRITRSPFYHDDVGSFWYQAIVIREGRIQRSAGLKDNTEQGLSTKVFRISVRQSEGYVGYLTSFHNVPGIFGSVPKQSNNYIGVDCADVLMAAYGKWKNKPMPNEYNVQMLADTLTLVAEFDIDDGKCTKQLKWKTDIMPGDFIAVRYPSSRQYAHIGALYSDANNNGLLDEQDLIIHAGPAPLHISKLKEGNFNGKVKILRP